MSELSAAAVALMDSLTVPAPPKDAISAHDYARHTGLTVRGAALRLDRLGLKSGIFRSPAGRQTRYYWRE